MIAAWLLSWRPSLSPNSALRRPEPRSVRDDRLANNLAEAHWYGVADEASQHAEADGLARRYELVLGWEGLQDRSFPQGDGPILLGVTEPPVPVPEALSSDRRTRVIPRHPAIHTRICGAGTLPMAGRLELIGPIAPCTARLRVAYPFKVGLAQS